MHLRGSWYYSQGLEDPIPKEKCFLLVVHPIARHVIRNFYGCTGHEQQSSTLTVTRQRSIDEFTSAPRSLVSGVEAGPSVDLDITHLTSERNESSQPISNE